MTSCLCDGSWDGGAHTDAQYEMAMLYGLNTSDTNATADQVATLNQEYNSLLTKYNLTAAQLTTFYNTQIYAPASNKLPTGCN